MNSKLFSPWDSLYVRIPKNLPEVLRKQYNRLAKIAPALEEPIDLRKLLAAMTLAIDEERLTVHDLADNKQEELLSQDINVRQLCQFHSTCITYLCAKRKMDQGDENEAWPLACHTSYLIGVTEDGLFLAAKAKEARRKAEAGLPGRQKGGKATKAKYDRVRKIMAELIEANTPSGGWTTKTQAVNHVYEELVMSASDLDVQFPDLHSTALRWLQDSGMAKIKLIDKKN
ncbi:hypothetical protein [Pseudomonas viridiflava]|uniref:hypothetical protein n=1 Tax=Pseudomonas viridiflava TaxID=33069 RepID=UPI000F02130A|nr:hypothetical protein [Pseudomonas viridiflava]